MRKHSIVFLIVLAFVLMLSGCTSYSLTSHQEDLVAEYAADTLLQSDRYYSKKLLKENEIETQTQEQETTDDTDNENTDGGEVSDITMSQALGMQDFIIDYTSYEISDTYTNSVVAGEGLKVIVLKFNVTNITSSESTFDLEPTTLNYTYKGTFNETYTYNEQITMLLNALNSYKATFAPGETQEVVLIYKAPTEQLVDGITNISITVNTGESSNIIKLQ